MNDPIKGCDVYKNIGCAHVDGFLCDYPNCSILKDYKMNERILELAGRCEGRTICECGEAGFNFKKFAELLIRECAGICEKDGRWWAEKGYLMEAGEAGSLATQIREHFGVVK